MVLGSKGIKYPTRIHGIYITSLKIHKSPPEKGPIHKDVVHLPSINFQGRTVCFQGGENVAWYAKGLHLLRFPYDIYVYISLSNINEYMICFLRNLLEVYDRLDVKCLKDLIWELKNDSKQWELLTTLNPQHFLFMFSWWLFFHV